MHLYIKNMVCDRCIMAVRNELERQNLSYKNVKLGEVELAEPASTSQLKNLEEGLAVIGFEILNDSKSQLVEKIKNVIVSLIHRGDDDLNLKLSALLEERLHKDYHYLTTLFSSVEGVTIEKYAILQRIERVKELLVYNQNSVGEIADALNYSSVQHLSQQFKKVTGLTPSQFRELKENKRKSIDKL